MFFLLKLILFFFLFMFALGFFSLIVLRYKVKRFLKKTPVVLPRQSLSVNRARFGWMISAIHRKAPVS